MLDTNCDPSLVANPGNFDQNFDQNFNLDEYFPSTVDANCNSLMPSDYETIGNDLTQITQFDSTTYGLESDDSINNSQSDPIIGTEAIAGTQDGLMLEAGESGIQLPDTTGSYSVGTTNYEWVDPMRDETYTEDPTDKRELTVKVWYPSEKVAEGKTAAYIDNEEVVTAIAKELELSDGIPAEQSISLFDSIKTNSIAEAPIAQTESEYPVLVFSPGLGGIPEEYTAQAEQLASQGYVVVGINHAYDAVATGFSDGRTVQIDPKLYDLNQEAMIESVAIRAADARFVLDQLELVNTSDPQEILTHHLDLDHVGIFGHSNGGATANLVVSQDPRFDAGINMDGNLYEAEKSGGDLTQPFMFMNSEGAIALAPSKQTFYENLPNDAFNLTIKGSTHSSFSDVPLLENLLDSKATSDTTNSDPITQIDLDRGTTIINDYTLAFFDKYLKNEQEPLLEGSSSDYPEVMLESHQNK
jgi:dienelactone hydrolase